jgi:hypothetical protein
MTGVYFEIHAYHQQIFYYSQSLVYSFSIPGKARVIVTAKHKPAE